MLDAIWTRFARTWFGSPRAEEHRELALEELLAPERWEPTTQRSAELVKALAYVQQMVTQARRLLAVSNPDRVETVRDELRQLLRRDPAELRIDAAWELYTALKQTLLLIADQPYLSMLLDYEGSRGQQRGTWHGWTDHFGVEHLHRLQGQVDQGDASGISESISRLTFLYNKRAEAGRDRRAKSAAKCRSVTVLVPFLFALLAVFAIAIVVNDRSSWRMVLLAASAGALGSMLAGILKLRDELAELEDLRTFGATIRLQPLIGGTAGLIVLLVLDSGVIQTGGSDGEGLPLRGLVAFVAGFSEPFFLGLVQRIAVVTEKPAA